MLERVLVGTGGVVDVINGYVHVAFRGTGFLDPLVKIPSHVAQFRNIQFGVEVK